MTGRIGRGGRKGQTHTATPGLTSYDVPPASAVTVTRPDGTTETLPAAKAQPVKRPTRRSRMRGPLVCAWCGQPIAGEPARSKEPRSKGKPVHPRGECPREEPKRATKPDPASTLPRPRGGSPQPYKDPNTRAVRPEQWMKLTCPKCGAVPGSPCATRTGKGTVKSLSLPHQERPQMVRRVIAAAAKAKGT